MVYGQVPGPGQCMYCKQVFTNMHVGQGHANWCLLLHPVEALEVHTHVRTGLTHEQRPVVNLVLVFLLVLWLRRYLGL